ncbi:unnamed protein product [Trichobilharzia szidati]|nr:unnamed protein product [Trichobilharzia szidati]
MSVDYNRKRSGSLVPRIVENLPNDPITGQSILFRTAFKGRGYSKIIDPAGFSDGKANQLLPKHLRKKRNHGYLYCLSDRIRFEKKSRSKLFRDQVFYQDIKFIYFFSNLPNVFMLALNDEKQRRIYETYTVNTMEDRNKIAELTQNKNPSGKLRTSISSHTLDYGIDAHNNGCTSTEEDEHNEEEEQESNCHTCRANTRYYRGSSRRISEIPSSHSHSCDNFRTVGDYPIRDSYSSQTGIPPYFKVTSTSRALSSPVHSSYSRQHRRSHAGRSPSPTDYLVLQYQGKNSHPHHRRSIYSASRYDTGENPVPLPSSEPLLADNLFRDEGPIYLYVQRRPSKSEMHGEGPNGYTKSPSGLTIYR